MYVLAELKDVVRIPPELFKLPQKQAIADELNKKLANRVSKCDLNLEFDNYLIII